MCDKSLCDKSLHDKSWSNKWAACRAGPRAPLDIGMREIVRTNDAVLITAIEALLSASPSAEEEAMARLVALKKRAPWERGLARPPRIDAMPKLTKRFIDTLRPLTL